VGVSDPAVVALLGEQQAALPDVRLFMDTTPDALRLSSSLRGWAPWVSGRAVGVASCDKKDEEQNRITVCETSQIGEVRCLTSGAS